MNHFKKLSLGMACCLCFSAAVLANDFSGKYEGKEAALQVKHSGDKIEFSVTTANANCTGEVSDAIAALQGNVATFAGESDCKLSIEFKGKKEAVIQEENCSFYHGMSCSFAGNYAKKSAMPKKAITAQ